MEPYRAVIVGTSLPEGQRARVNPPRWSHPTIAHQVAGAPDGTLVSASSEHVRFWDPVSGALRWQFFDPAAQTRFALSRDGKLFAIAQGRFDEARIAIYEGSGTPRISFESGSVTALAFSLDGSKLVTSGPTTRLYQTVDGKRLGSLKVKALSIGFAEDGTVIVIARNGIYRWDGVGDLEASLQAFPAPPSTAVVSPSGNAAAWAHGTSLEVANLSGTSVKIESLGASSTTALALSAKGDVVLAGGPGGVEAWDVQAVPTRRWQLKTRGNSRPALAFDAAGSAVVISDARGVFTVDAATGKELHAREARARFLGFSENGNLLVSQGLEVESIDLHTGSRIVVPLLPEGAPSWVDSVLYGADAMAIGWNALGATECKALKVWMPDIGTRTFPSPASCTNAEEDPWLLGPGFVVMEAARKSTVWDVVSNQPKLELPHSQYPRINLSFSANRRWMVAAYGSDSRMDRSSEQESFVAVFDLAVPPSAARSRPARVLAWEESHALRAVTILADGTVYAGSAKGEVFVAGPDEESFQKEAQVDAGVSFLEASPSGTTVAVTDQDGATLVLEQR